MSAARAYAPSPSVQPGTTPKGARPGLRVVAPAAASRSRVPFVIMCAAILIAALLGVLVLNTTMAAGSYKQQELTSKLARLDESAQSLSEQVEAKRSPGQLAAQATELGMVPAPQPAFIRLSDHAILGNPIPAGLPAAPVAATEPESAESADAG